MAVELATGVVTLTVSAEGMGRSIIDDLSRDFAKGADKLGRKLGDGLETKLASKGDAIGKQLGDDIADKLSASFRGKGGDLGKKLKDEIEDGLGGAPEIPPPSIKVPTDEIGKIARELARLGDEPIDLDIRDNVIAVQRIQRQIDRLSDQAIDLDIDLSGQLGPLRSELERRLGESVEVPIEVEDGSSLGGDWADGFLGGAAGLTAGIAGLLAGGVSAFLVDGFADAIGRDANIDLQGARFGIPEDEIARAGEVAGQVYGDNFGDSIDDNLLALVNLDAGGLDIEGASSEELGRRIIDVDAVGRFLELEADEITTLFTSSLSQGLADDSTEIADAIIGGLVGLQDEAREELPDFFKEYSKFFDQLGLDVGDTVALLESAGDDIATAMDIDRFGDLFKELGNVVLDPDGLDEAATAAIEALSLDPDDVRAAFAEGGDAARDALEDLLTELGDVADNDQQQSLFKTLFGTQAEDFGADFDIGRFADALALDPAQFDGATDLFNETTLNNDLSRWEEFWRSVEARQNDGFKRLHDGFEEGGFGGLFEAGIAEADLLWGELEPKLSAFIEEDFVPWWDETAKPAAADAVVAALKGAASEGGRAMIGELVLIPYRLPEILGGFFADIGLDIWADEGSDLVDGLWAGATDKFREVQDWAGGLPDDLVAAVGELDDLLFGAGQDIINGLRDGIEDKLGGLLSWFGDQIGSLGGIARSVLLIESPSRVFAEIGDQIGAGLQLGIENSTPDVQLAVADMAGSLPAYVQTPDVAAPVAAVNSGPTYPIYVDNLTVANDIEEISRELAVLGVGR